ncbi:PADRE domain [Dillenia turbinata]|uniref:PADRE domain n=1 Tax=Dillenia turbinata TaxID=194707 RepID=A0AAN8VWA3_9MAGN
MFEFPDRLVCHADSFFIGQRIPALSIDDQLCAGQTYFILPIDRFACNILSVSSLAALSTSPKPRPINFSDCPFEYIKNSNGRLLIKLVPESITKLITNTDKTACDGNKLKRHYEQLVGSGEHLWSPKLETISEHKIRISSSVFTNGWKKLHTNDDG